VSGPGEHPKKIWDPYISLQPLKLATSHLVHKLGLGLAYQKKRRLGPKLAGSWLGMHPKKIGTPYLFLQSLKLETSNLVYNLGLGLSYQKQSLELNWRGVGQGSMRKNLGPPIYFRNR